MSTPEDPYAGQPAPDHGTPTEPQQGYYAQPAAPYYYGPPPQKVPSRGAWFAIGAGSMFALGVVGFFGFFIFMGLMFSDGFEEDGAEYAYYVDQESVVEAVDGLCSNMRSAAYEIKVFSGPEDASVDIARFTLAIKGIVEAIDSADPNSDSKLWRDDWQTLGADLDTYAADLKTKGDDAVFTSITDDVPTIARMSYSSDADCEVPQVIEGLDPNLADYWD